MMEVRVRHAVESDVKVVHRFICDLEGREFEFEPFNASYLKNLQSPDTIYLIAENDHERIGLLTCHGQNLLHHLGKVYEIQELIVKEDVRGLGVGKALLMQLEKELEGKDYKMLEVASNVRRTRAHEFYIREGFLKSHYKFTKPKR